MANLFVSSATVPSRTESCSPNTSKFKDQSSQATVGIRKPQALLQDLFCVHSLFWMPFVYPMNCGGFSNGVFGPGAFSDRGACCFGWVSQLGAYRDGSAWEMQLKSSQPFHYLISNLGECLVFGSPLYMKRRLYFSGIFGATIFSNIFGLN